jgi:hypothetical protein
MFSVWLRIQTNKTFWICILNNVPFSRIEFESKKMGESRKRKPSYININIKGKTFWNGDSFSYRFSSYSVNCFSYRAFISLWSPNFSFSFLQRCFSKVFSVYLSKNISIPYQAKLHGFSGKKYGVSNESVWKLCCTYFPFHNCFNLLYRVSGLEVWYFASCNMQTIWLLHGECHTLKVGLSF